MRIVLSERLLAGDVEWTPEDATRERPVLQVLAAFKYDENQQFGPDIWFVVSLALLRDQFKTLMKGQAAYQFILSRLIFLSHAAMAHFSTIAFPDVARPMFIEQAATNSNPAPFLASGSVRNRAVFAALRAYLRAEVPALETLAKRQFRPPATVAIP